MTPTAIRRALVLATERNNWLKSNDPGAMLLELFDVVQLAFDAGRAVEAKSTALRLHAAAVMPLPALPNTSNN